MPKKRNPRKRKKPQLKPPPSAVAVARSYQCTDCNSETELVPDPIGPGMWKVNVFHDEGCPVLTGHVSKTEAGISALAQVPGSALYVDLDPPPAA